MYIRGKAALLAGQVPGLTAEAAAAALTQVTFLGRGAMVLGKFGVHYVQERAQRWAVPWKIIARMGPVVRSRRSFQLYWLKKYSALLYRLKSTLLLQCFQLLLVEKYSALLYWLKRTLLYSVFSCTGCEKYSCFTG